MFRISLFLYILFSSMSVIVFIFPLYLQNQGLNPGQIGNIVALGSLVSMFASLFWGYVSDKSKTIKRILQFGLISSLLLSIGLFSAKSFIVILLFYGIFKFFNSPSGTLSETLTVSYAHRNNRDFGRIRLWGEVGVGVSALTLGMIAERIGINNLWFIYAVTVVFAILATFLLEDVKATTKPVKITTLRKALIQPKLLWFLFIVLLMGIPHLMNDSMLAIFLSQLGAAESKVGLAWLVATLSTIPALIFVGKMINKWNELAIFVIAALIYTVRWFVYSQAQSPSVLIAAQLLHSLTFPLLLVASVQYIFRIVPEEMRATGQATFAVTFYGLAAIIGNSAGGYIFEHYGPHTAYAAGSVLALIGAIAAMATYVVGKRMDAQRDFTTRGEDSNI